MSDAPSLLPNNATPLERSLDLFPVHIAPDPKRIATLWDAESCPAHLLPYLAWAFSVDDWQDDWPETQRRQVLLDTIAVHRRKGTVRAVKDAPASAGIGDAQVIERHSWEKHNGAMTYNGTPTYSTPDYWAEYRVRLNPPVTIEQASQVPTISTSPQTVTCSIASSKTIMTALWVMKSASCWRQTLDSLLMGLFMMPA